MANFVSTQTGVVNNGATFGNASPGVRGIDWPGLAGDTFTVTSGHTVTYNVFETNELGQVDVEGKLSFGGGANRLLTLGHVNLNVADGGELEIGTDGGNFTATWTAEILWNVTNDNQKGLHIADGGKLTIYGASDYCAVYEDTLADDVENTDGDTVIKTVNNMSGDWHIGDELTIKVEDMGGGASSRTTIKRAVIQGFIAGNSITLDIDITAEAGVGDTWISPVVNVTRNVQLGKYGADVDCGDGSAHYNTDRPKFRDVNADGNDNCVFSHAMATGFYEINSDYAFQSLNSTVRNGQNGFTGGSGHTISGGVYSHDMGFNGGTDHIVSGGVYANAMGFSGGTGHTISGAAYSNDYCFIDGTGHTISGGVHGNGYGFFRGAGHTISGGVYSNSYGFYRGTGHTILGNIYNNYYGFYGGTGHTISGRIGYDSGDVSKPNTTWDIYTDGYSKYVLLNAKLPLAGLSVHRNMSRVTTRVMCEHHNRVANAHKIYDNNGDIVKVVCNGGDGRPSEDPDGGNAACTELSNIQNDCSSDNPLRVWEEHQYRIWVPASVSQTYTFKVQTTYAGISAGNLELTASYLDEGSGGHLGEQTDAPAINQRGNAADWTQTLAVTVDPSQTGWIDFAITLMEYESGNEVWIWPEVGIS